LVGSVRGAVRSKRDGVGRVDRGGFFVSFSVPATAPRVDAPNASGGVVTMELEGLEHGSGCILFVRDGVISILEGYAYGEPFPDPPVVVALRDAVPIVSGTSSGSQSGREAGGLGPTERSVLLSATTSGLPLAVATVDLGVPIASPQERHSRVRAHSVPHSVAHTVSRPGSWKKRCPHRGHRKRMMETKDTSIMAMGSQGNHRGASVPSGFTAANALRRRRRRTQSKRVSSSAASPRRPCTDRKPLVRALCTDCASGCAL